MMQDDRLHMQWRIQKLKKGGALPPDRAISGSVRMRTKFIRARAAKRTEKKGGARAPWAPHPGSATDMSSTVQKHAQREYL